MELHRQTAAGRIRGQGPQWQAMQGKVALPPTQVYHIHRPFSPQRRVVLGIGKEDVLAAQ